MMVNQVNNNSAPWPSTVPTQMPWMNSHQSSMTEMSFGQSFNHTTSLASPTIESALSQPVSIPTSLSTLHQLPTVTPGITVPPISPYQLDCNPFEPNLINQAPSFNHVATSQFSPQGSSATILPMPSNIISQPTFNSQSLTHIELDHDQSKTFCFPQKRNSIEMEDEMIKEEEPPTKQQLSENNLFMRFGSLQLHNDDIASKLNEDPDLIDNSDEDQGSEGEVKGRKEFSRYVYLLFKDKKTGANGVPYNHSNSAIDRLIREEREKLSKAVILWNPPLHGGFCSDSYVVEEDDDDDFEYSNHTDFLKKKEEHEDSLIITEVTDDDSQHTDLHTIKAGTLETDDVMIEE